MDKPAFGGTPITPIHDPWCGYWTKGPGLPGYNGRLYTFTNTGGASRAYGYRINVDDMSFVLTKLWDATAITTFPSNYGRMKYADYFGRIYIVGYSGNRPHVYEMDIDNLNILAKRIVGTVVEGTDGLKYCAINDWTMQDLNRPITGWGYTSYWSTLDADVTSYILSPWVGDAAFRSINGLDVQTEYYNGSFYTMRNNTAYGPAVKSNRESGAISGSLGDDILAYPQVYNDKLWAMKERGFGSWFCEYDLNLTWVRETALPNSGGYTCFPCMFDNHAYFTSSVWPTAGDKSIIRLDLGDFSTVSYHDALYNTWSSVKVASDGKLYATGSGGWGRFDSGTLALEAVYSSYGSPYGIEIGFDSAGREYAFGVWQHADLSWRIVKIGPLPSLTFAGMTPALTGVPYNKILYIDP